MKRIPYEANLPKYMTIDEAYEHLAKSIVIQAIKDYRTIIRNNRIKYVSQTKWNKFEIEAFFKSEWCHFLCEVDGEKLIKTIQEQENYKCCN